MELLIWILIGLLVAGCFAAGTLPGDHWLDIVVGWDKVRFSITNWERTINIGGVVLTVIAQIVAGFFRLLTAGMGVLMILTERAGEKVASSLPFYPEEKPKEIEE